jgi:hypothetical protein
MYHLCATLAKSPLKSLQNFKRDNLSGFEIYGVYVIWYSSLGGVFQIQQQVEEIKQT